MSESPTLHLSFPGVWHEIDLSDEASTKGSIEKIAIDSCGVGDEAAKARVFLKEKLKRAAREARDGSASAVYLGSELVPGVPLPVTLTVFEPHDLRMSPAVGADAGQVLHILRQGLTGRFEELSDIDGGNFSALRTVIREDEDRWYEDGDGNASPDEASYRVEADQIKIRRLRVDYWCHVPGTKSAIIVSFATDLSAIENVLLVLFDAMIGAAHFEVPAVVPEPEAFGQEESVTDEVALHLSA